MLSRTKNRDFCLRQNKFELARTKYGDFGPDHNQNNHPNLEVRADDGVPSHRHLPHIQHTTPNLYVQLECSERPISCTYSREAGREMPGPGRA